MLHDLEACKKKGNGIKGIFFGLPQPPPPSLVKKRTYVSYNLVPS